MIKPTASNHPGTAYPILLRLLTTGLLLATMSLPLAAETPVTVQDPALPRVVSADASATELILAMELGHRLVGIDITSELPAGFGKLPSIGYHRNLSAEGLLSLAPTMVIGSEHMGPPPVINALTSAGVEWVKLHNAVDSGQLLENIRRVGTATDRSELAERLVARVQQQLDKLQQQSLTGARIAFLLQRDSQLRLAGANTGGDALITLLGGNNVADFSQYRNVTAESLLALQPDIILLSTDGAGATDQLLAQHPALAYSNAGRDNRIFGVEGKLLVAGLSIAAVDAAVTLQQQIKRDRR